jgi:hypothetical protein
MGIEQPAGVHGRSHGLGAGLHQSRPRSGDALLRRGGVAARRGCRRGTLLPICEFICAKSHIRVTHTGLGILGCPVGPPRRRLRPLAAEDRATLAAILAEVGARTG